MPAKTPANTWSELTYNAGDGAVVRNTDPARVTYDFTSTVNIDDTDTFASGLSGVRSFSFIVTTAGGAVGVSESDGTFTFQTDAANREGYLIVERDL